jgi:hypothetical protein
MKTQVKGELYLHQKSSKGWTWGLMKNQVKDELYLHQKSSKGWTWGLMKTHRRSTAPSGGVALPSGSKEYKVCGGLMEKSVCRKYPLKRIISCLIGESRKKNPSSLI